MNEFLKSLASILEVPIVNPGDDLKDFPQWDSLAALSVTSLVTTYGVEVIIIDFEKIKSAAELWDFVQRRREHRQPMPPADPSQPALAEP